MEDYIAIYNDLFKNKEVLLRSNKCGCFHCLSIFNPNQISEWTSSTKEVAICPYCGIDSVIPDSQKTPISKDFLRKLKHYWL